MSTKHAPFNISEYLSAFRGHDGDGHPDETGYRSHFPLAGRITCVDGFSLSVQASNGAYCSPRDNLGPWHEVEVGYPSAPPEFISHLAENPNDLTATIYAYVDTGIVEKLIELHGGPDQETLSKAEAARQKGGAA